MSDQDLPVAIFLEWDGRELDISTDMHGLAKLRNWCSDSETDVIVRPVDGESIRAVRLERLQGRLVIRIDGTTATISGGPEAMGILTSNLEFLLSDWKAGKFKHLHLDPDSNPFLVDPGSESMIVSFKAPSGS